MKGYRLALVVGVLAVGLGACAAGADQSLDQVDKAQGVAGQVRLQTAATAMTSFLSENGSFNGFDAAAGEQFEPSLNWVDGGPAADGVVSVRGVTSTSAVLVTADGGAITCLAQSYPAAAYLGTADAETAADCH